MARSFAMDTSSMATANPLLETGLYAGAIIGATIEGKENKQYFTIREEKKWNKETKVMEATGQHELSGMLMYSVALTSKKAIQILQEDEPRIFGGMIFFSFDKETYIMKDNVQLAQLLKALDLQDTNFAEAVDFEIDEDIEVPKDLAEVDDIVMKLNGLAYAKELLTVICQTINDMPVRARVSKQAVRDNPEVQENTLSMGTRQAPSCGVIAYEDGAEEDLED